MASRKKRAATLFRCTVGAVVLFLAVCGYVCFERTLVVWWLPVALAGLVAAVTMPLWGSRWEWLTASRDAVVNRLCHLCVVGVVAYFGCLGGNLLPADERSAYEESALVERKARQERKEYRRVNRRNRVVRVRDVWCLYVRFDNGMSKRVEVPLSRYRSVKENERIRFGMRRGVLGYPVIRSVGAVEREPDARTRSAS